MTLAVDDTELAVPGPLQAPIRRHRHARTSPDWVARCGVIGAFSLWVAFVSLVYWPGQTDPDTMDELTQAATGHFHGLAHSDSLRLVEDSVLDGHHQPRLGPGGGPLRPSHRLLSNPEGAFSPWRINRDRDRVLAWPPVLSWGVHVGRDAWYAELSLSRSASRLAWSGWERSSRGLNVAACLTFAFLAAAAWQLGVVALVALFVFVALSLFPRTYHAALWWVRHGPRSCLRALRAPVGPPEGDQHEAIHPEQATYDLRPRADVTDAGQSSLSR